MDLRAIATSHDCQFQKRRLKPSLFRQVSKLFGLLKLVLRAKCQALDERLTRNTEDQAYTALTS